MSYVTPVDLRATFEERDLVAATNLNDPRAEEIVEERLEQHCAIATGIINGYLLNRFVIPLQGASVELLETLKAHAINLARESLDASSEEVRIKADNSRKWLESFSQASNTESNDTTPGVDPVSGINYSVREPTWTEERLGAIGWS
jgi:phage gp36-like protein